MKFATTMAVTRRWTGKNGQAACPTAAAIMCRNPYSAGRISDAPNRGRKSAETAGYCSAIRIIGENKDLATRYPRSGRNLAGLCAVKFAGRNVAYARPPNKIDSRREKRYIRFNSLRSDLPTPT